jgi:hypothetical protein
LPLPPRTRQAEADRRVIAAVSDLLAAIQRGDPEAEVVASMTKALTVIRDDLEARHGEDGEDAFSAATATAYVIMTQAWRRPA